MCLSCSCGRPDDDHGDSRHVTMAVLKSAAEAAGCTPEQAAANIISTMAGPATKSAPTADIAACRVVKATEEQRYTLGVAYPANKADVRMAADGHRDFVSPAVLEKTAWSWMTKHRDINLFHRNGTSGHGTVVESYLYRGPDWEQPSPVDGKPYVIKAGDWLLGATWDDYGWTLIKGGLINGWSPEGGARRAVPTAERLALLRS